MTAARSSRVSWTHHTWRTMAHNTPPSLALSFCSLFCDLLLSLEEAIWLSSLQLGSQPSFILNIWTNHESIINHCLPQRSSSDQLAQQHQSLRLSIKAWKTILTGTSTWQDSCSFRTRVSAMGFWPGLQYQTCNPSRGAGLDSSQRSYARCACPADPEHRFRRGRQLMTLLSGTSWHGEGWAGDV